MNLCYYFTFDVKINITVVLTFSFFFVRGAVYADNARFDRCLDLWLHALRLRQKNYISVVKDLLRFAQVFSQMLHVGLILEQHYVIEVLAAAITELERNKRKIDKPGPKLDPESIMVGDLYSLTVKLNHN